jgi:hypothetical protein
MDFNLLAKMKQEIQCFWLVEWLKLVERLPSKCGVLSQTPVMKRKRRRRRRRREKEKKENRKRSTVLWQQLILEQHGME